MKRLLSLLFASGILVVAAPAHAQGPYVDPLLRTVARPEIRQAIETLRPRAGERAPADSELPLGGTVAIDFGGPGGAPRVGMVVRLAAPGALEELRAAGAEIGTVVGDLATAYVPLATLDAVLGSRRLGALEAARTIRVQHDSSLIAIRADRVRRREGGEWVGFAGQGVVVGVYDTGIDYQHLDFRKGDGSTRLLGLWDQTTNGNPPGSFTYGFYCSPATLDGGTCPQRDINGHGTHVAGSAAGNGSATGSGGTAFEYAGVAPAADILVVKGGDGGFSSNRVIDGVNWIFAEAERLGKPAVANLSLGGQYGPHDGSTLYEQLLSSLTGPGKILAIAAGNDGGNRSPGAGFGPSLIHAMGPSVVGSTSSFTVRVPSYTANSGTCNDYFVLDLWYEGADRLNVTVVRPNGSTATAGYGEAVEDLATGGEILLENAEDGANPENGDNQVYIQVSDCAAAGNNPATGTWTIRVTPTVAASGQAYHMWLYASRLGTTTAFGADGFSNSHAIGIPGTAERAITVGAFVTRLCWPSVVGDQCSSLREEIGDIAYFSSPGPTRDGKLKPEISAPGRMIISALSSAASAPEYLVQPDRVHWAIQGTSMATPHVAGAIGLMLQANRNLTPENVEAILAQTANRDPFTSRTYFEGASRIDPAPNFQWGYGKLDVAAALGSLLGDPTAIASIRLAPRGDTLQPGETVPFSAVPTNALGDPVAGAVTWRSTNPAVATVGPSGRVQGVANGSAYIVASVGEVSDSAFVRVIAPATLEVEARPVTAPSAPQSGSGTVLPLLALQLDVRGDEAIDVRQLAFRVSGNDPGARLLVVHDVNGNGAIDASDPVLADSAARISPAAPREVRVAIPALRVPEGGSASIIVALRLSGAAPNASSFEVAYLPAETRTAGVLSGAQNRLDQPGSPVASGAVETTVLNADELFNLTENPIRGHRVIMNFREKPTTAAVYTLAGARVADLVPRLDASGRRVDWDLTNDAGKRIAPGIYLAVFQIGTETVREKLIVAGNEGL